MFYIVEIPVFNLMTSIIAESKVSQAICDKVTKAIMVSHTKYNNSPIA